MEKNTANSENVVSFYPGESPEDTAFINALMKQLDLTEELHNREMRADILKEFPRQTPEELSQKISQNCQAAISGK